MSNTKIITDRIREELKPMLLMYGYRYFLDAVARQWEHNAKQLEEAGFDPASLHMHKQAKKIQEALNLPFGLKEKPCERK